MGGNEIVARSLPLPEEGATVSGDLEWDTGTDLPVSTATGFASSTSWVTTPTPTSIETTVSCTGSIQTTLLTGHDPLTGTVHRRLRGRTHGWGGLTGHDQVVLLQMG